VNGFTEQSLLKQGATAAGFSVSVERELRQRYYPSLRALARELKGIGAHNMNEARPSGLTSRSAFARAEREFNKGLVAGQGIPVTWELYYLDLRKPR
jgi:malonyl-CoA O-methyltransferase